MTKILVLPACLCVLLWFGRSQFLWRPAEFPGALEWLKDLTDPNTPIADNLPV